MAISPTESETPRFGSDLDEVTGEIGDSVTVLPLVVALGLLTPASLARVAFTSTERPWLVGAIGVLAVATNVGVAFLAGVGRWRLREGGFLSDRALFSGMSWDRLFDRAEDYGVTAEEIRTALETRRDG